jgi:excisionase family DNA binding protein
VRPDAPLLTRKEVARRLHVSESTVIRLVRAGALAEARIGKRAVRYPPSSVEAIVRAGTRGPERRLA